MSTLPVSIGTISDVIPTNVVVPPVDYTSRDYASLVNDMLNLIPSYLPEWTDRSPGDFGIVFLELFAYMGDVLNFYIDRVANESFIGTAQQRQSVLNLANLLDYTPHGNVSAIVQLVQGSPTSGLVFTIASPQSNPVLVPAHTQVSTILTGTQSVIFETTADLWIYGDGVQSTKTVTSSGQPNQTVLLSDPTKPYPTYNFTGGTGNQTVTVAGTTWTLAPSNSFNGQLATATMYIIVHGNTLQFGNGVNGAIPASGASIVVTFQPAAANTYQGQVSAIQGVSTIGEGIGISDGTPNQQYTLFNSPVVDGSLSPPMGNVYVDEGAGPIPWTYHQRMIDAFSSEGAFTYTVDANGVVTIQFGDNVTGRIPAPGAFITADYMVGGGAIGNVAANSLTQMMTSVYGVISVTNPQAAAGGADAETTDHIRIHAPLSISAINRAVTLDDYAALVLNIPQIAKAAAMSTGYNSVNLYIHPSGDFFATGPTDTNGLATLTARVNGLLPSITNSGYTGYMDDKKMVGTSIVVIPPQYNNAGTLTTGYVPCNVTATVQVLPQYHQSTVQGAVQAAIQNLFLFSVVDFGSRITLSSVYHACMNVEGVDYVNVNLMARNEANQTVIGDIVCAANEIPRAYQINVNAQGGIVY